MRSERGEKQVDSFFGDPSDLFEMQRVHSNGDKSN